MHHEDKSYDGWIGRNAYDPSGEKVGKIDDIFYDDKTGRPEWVAIKTGLFGPKQTFVPIHGSAIHDNDDDKDGGSLRLAFSKEMINDAPNIDPEGHMSPQEEQELWKYYGYDYNFDDTARKTDYGYGANYDQRADKDFTYDRRQTGAIGNVGMEDRGTVEAEATIRNQEAQVVEGTETVRLRKYQRTEMVPVTKEEVRVERVGDDDTLTEERVEGRIGNTQVTTDSKRK